MGEVPKAMPQLWGSTDNIQLNMSLTVRTTCGQMSSKVGSGRRDAPEYKRRERTHGRRCARRLTFQEEDLECQTEAGRTLELMESQGRPSKTICLPWVWWLFVKETEGTQIPNLAPTCLPTPSPFSIPCLLDWQEDWSDLRESSGIVLLLGHWLRTPHTYPSSWEVKRFCRKKSEERE